MNTYIALFRGINVGGRNILPMKELKTVLQELGCENVHTYIQSGNAVLQSLQQGDELAAAISSTIAGTHGFTPRVLLLRGTDLQQAVANNPFPTDDAKALHFHFLQTPADKPETDSLMLLKTATEECSLVANVFYLYAPDGIARSRLAAKVEKCLGVAVTARNWNTVKTLLAMVRSVEAE